MLSRLGIRTVARVSARCFSVSAIPRAASKAEDESAAERIRKAIDYESDEYNPDLQQRNYLVDQELKSVMKVDESTRTSHIKERENVNIGSATGVPSEQLVTRRVRIFVPSRTAMQSGTWQSGTWKIEWDTRERWENPLMGWSSSADPLSNTNLEFSSKEEAVRFCERNGWHYDIDEPHGVTWKTKSYAANFAWNKRTRISNK